MLTFFFGVFESNYPSLYIFDIRSFLMASWELWFWKWSNDCEGSRPKHLQVQIFFLANARMASATIVQFQKYEGEKKLNGSKNLKGKIEVEAF